IPLLAVFGIGDAYQLVCGRMLLQKSAHGRSLDLLAGVNALIAVSVVGAGGLSAAEINAAIGVRGTLRVAGGVAMLGVVYGLWRLRRVEGQLPSHSAQLDAIKCVGG